MRNNVTSIWTEEKIESLKQLHSKNYTCAEIAAELGSGFTRNSVIGKLHRMGITGGTKSMAQKERQLRAVVARARNAALRPPKPPAIRARILKQPVMQCLEVTPMGISIYDLGPDSCRYPEGEGANITFCGHTCFGEKSYCFAHHRLVTDRTRLRSKAEREIHRRKTRAEYFKASMEVST